MNQPRTYRHRIQKEGLTTFNITVRETDLLIRADKPLDRIALNSILCHRRFLEAFIAQHPVFATSLVPWTVSEPMPAIVWDMIRAGQKAGVGPMASVAGAVSQRVGEDLSVYSKEVIIENGGDVYIKTDAPVTVGIYAGKSPLSLRIGLNIASGNAPMAVCTSSGTVGHSLSFGNADAVSVVSKSCALADAAATAIGNRVLSAKEIQQAMAFGQTIDGVEGILIIVGEQMGVWGKLELVPLSGGKNG
ncbi:MAG: UPF0280 family protein [Desulfobacterales bacterium]|nr:UPF0280 family protein [Desulfobacterales bacterium]